MRSCWLRSSITIQSRAETRSSSGAVSWTWADYKTVRASVEPIKGQEYFAAKQLQASTTTRIKMRYISGITTKMRVKHGTRYYAIEAVINPLSKNRELHLMCVEREADGWRD